MSAFALDQSDFDRLAEAMKKAADNAEKAVTDSLNSTEVKKILMNSITNLTPVSSAKIASWHPVHAKEAKPYTSKKENLSITIKSKKQFGYLYFPDDGSNTKNHVGMQQFMIKGAEQVKDSVIDIVINKIIEEL